MKFVVRIVLLAGLVLTSAPLAAQPLLTVEPDTLVYPGEDETRLINTGQETLRVDSLHFTVTLHNYFVDVVLSDSSFTLGFFGGVPDPSGTTPSSSFPVFEIVPGDTVFLRITGYDPCNACKRRALAEITDTLWIYQDVPEPDTQRIFIDASRRVASEPVPEVPGLQVTVFPNPFHHQTQVVLTANQAGWYELAIYDVLGRMLERRRVFLHTGESRKLRWPEEVDGLAGGVYFVRLARDGVPMAARSVIHVPASGSSP